MYTLAFTIPLLEAVTVRLILKSIQTNWVARQEAACKSHLCSINENQTNMSAVQHWTHIQCSLTWILHNAGKRKTIHLEQQNPLHPVLTVYFNKTPRHSWLKYFEQVDPQSNEPRFGINYKRKNKHMSRHCCNERKCTVMEVCLTQHLAKKENRQVEIQENSNLQTLNGWVFGGLTCVRICWRKNIMELTIYFQVFSILHLWFIFKSSRNNRNICKEQIIKLPTKWC